jgi:two-component system response regulator RpaA
MKKKVLLVDDDLAFCEMVKKGLEAAGDFQVCFCLNSSESIREVIAYGPDIILLDVLMPEMSGKLVGAQLKLDDRTKNIPIVFLTGMGVDPTRGMRPESDGRFCYVKKPVKIEQLAKSVSRLIADAAAAGK